MSPADVVLTCRDCALGFIFTAEERESQAQVGRSHPPSRCPECRVARKARQDLMGGVRAAPGFRDRREQPMTTTTCSSCGKPAQVPFVVRGVILAVNQQLRFDEGMAAAHRMVETGWIGAITAMSITVDIWTDFSAWPWMLDTDRLEISNQVCTRSTSR